MKVLDIFCDASITTIGSEYIGCAGAIAIVRETDNNTRKIEKFECLDEHYRILRNSTNNNSEITAILCGVMLAVKYNGIYDQINIISDSKICIYGLTDWIFSWIQLYVSNGYGLYGSAGLIANQSIFIKIINIIIKNNLSIHFYHQKGHTDKCTLQKARDTFEKSNNIILNDNILLYINKHNDFIDLSTRCYLRIYIESNGAANNETIRVYDHLKFQSPVKECLNVDDVKNIYSRCIARIGGKNDF